MKLESAELLVEVLEGFIPIDLYEDYSGRGMYGKTTSGVTVNGLTEFMNGIGYFLQSCGEEDAEQVRALGEALTGLTSDHMGYDIIIY
jgi:hypothetical protein